MATPLSDEKPKSRCPKDTDFKQQRLPAWQPILTAGTVLPAFFAIGIAFIPLGVALLITSENVSEVVRDYTYCIQVGTNTTCAEYLTDKNRTNYYQTCKCSIEIELTSDFTGSVYMYYGLNNYYQNHRRYVKSRDDDQLRGNNLKPSAILSDCAPFASSNGKSIAPAGAIANSKFNDTIGLIYKGNGSQTTSVPLLRTGIAWYSDRHVKFQNPANLTTGFSDTVKPPAWPLPVNKLDVGDSANNGYQNEDLIVWMRTAALPNFRKLYRRIEHKATFKDGLPKGKYIFDITYAYPVTSFGGTKSIILTTTSWLGGKNNFLGIAYLVVGSICIILGIVFVIIHLKIGKKTQEMIAVNNRTSY